jgi:hypothetical protein
MYTAQISKRKFAHDKEVSVSVSVSVSVRNQRKGKQLYLK